jgi:DNA-binding NarL/FixJ family response regulator
VFGDPAGPEDVVAALRAGAGGWMTRAASAEAIGDAVRRVADGHCALDGLAQDSLTTSVLATPVPRAALAKRELEVLRLAAQGQSTPQIAATLFLGERTVKTYLARASLKLGTSGRTAAVAVAIQQQLL